MNHGDTIKIVLAYEVDGEPITENQFDEIEFCIGSKRFTLSGGGVTWDSTESAYTVWLTQTDTFTMPMSVPYQTRFKSGDDVISSGEATLDLGNTISRIVL